jgi:hypothetical protein
VAEGGLLTGLPHELVRQPQPPVRTHHTETGDVPVLHAVGRFFLHLSEDISDDLGRLIWVLGRVAQVHGYVRELRPRKCMVEVVLEEVVLRQVRDVGLLNMRNVRGAEESDIHCVCVVAMWYEGGARGVGGEVLNRVSLVRLKIPTGVLCSLTRLHSMNSKTLDSKNKNTFEHSFYISIQTDARGYTIDTISLSTEQDELPLKPHRGKQRRK